MLNSRAGRTISALTVTSLLAVPAAASAVKVPTIDLWSGKTKSKKLAASINNLRGKKTAYVSLDVTCKNSEGQTADYGLSGKGTITSGKLSIDIKKAYNGASGTLKISAKVPRTKAATGTATWTLPASFGTGCSGHDTFTLKHQISHGG